MLNRHLTTCLRLAASTLVLTASSLYAQVDWSELFPDEAAPAAKAEQPPKRPQPAPAPAQPKAQVIDRSPQRPQVAAKPRPAPAQARPAPAQRAASRKVAPPRQQDDREFPSVAEAAPLRRDRQSSQRSAPPPARPVEERVAEEPAEPPAAVAVAPATVEPQHAPAPPVAVAEEPPPAPAAADISDEPAVNENVQAAARAPQPEPEPVAVAPVAPLPSRVKKSAAAPQPAPPPVEEVAAPQDEPEVADVPAEGTQLASAGRGGNPLVSGADVGAPPGTLITDSNVDQYLHLLSPGLEWAVKYGWRIKVGEPRRIEMIRAYREATEKHLGQAKLRPDGLQVLNWTAGQPFPNLDPNDPQIAQKIMWNYGYGFAVTDDVSSKNFDADTGSIGKGRGMTVERHYMIDNLRRLNYTGRLFVDPKPNYPNPDDLRYKESLHPLSEPFDLKGVGGTFYRYNDPNRQDDSWLYLPQLRRVRRLSTAQRSDALFGQDSDVDSYYGYTGHIAWMDWKFLGERTVLAVMHGQHVPVKWQEPEDWAFEDTWEPRQVYVVEGTSKLPQYAYGKRVIFIDKEGWVVTHSDIYDRAGQLWKVWINDYSFKKEAIPGATVSRYPDEMAFVHAIVMIDTQLVHATKAALPSTHSQGEECIYINMGNKSGITEDFFTVAHLIESGH